VAGTTTATTTTLTTTMTTTMTTTTEMCNVSVAGLENAQHS